MSISTAMFNYHSADKMFTAEMSTLQCGSKNIKVFERLYDDACDIGIFLTSHKTGKDVKFYVDKEIRSTEGELTDWVLKPCDEEIRKHPALKDVTIHIFND
jgi:hypothetical protein